jgi:hypothetical protein
MGVYFLDTSAPFPNPCVFSPEAVESQYGSTRFWGDNTGRSSEIAVEG